MPLNLGSSAVTLYLGDQSVTGYLGSQIVTATVPGAPTIVNATYSLVGGMDTNVVTFTAPESDGGSPITSYLFYFDGSQVAPDSVVDGVATFTGQSFSNQDAEVSAVNAAGEGPKSEPAVVSAV